MSNDSTFNHQRFIPGRAACNSEVLPVIHGRHPDESASVNLPAPDDPLAMPYPPRFTMVGELGFASGEEVICRDRAAPPSRSRVGLVEPVQPPSQVCETSNTVPRVTGTSDGGCPV